MAYFLEIGDVKLDNPLILAPMAGVTDVAFRILCRKNKASLACSEMVSSEALIRNNESTKRLLTTSPKDRPLSVQIFGNDEVTMAQAAKLIEKDVPCDMIDINLGCPAPDIVTQGSGAALLAKPEKIEKIASSVVEAVKLPVTAKIRTGIGQRQNALRNSRILEQAGVRAITIHGRSLKQAYSGKSDWSLIKRVHDSVSIPVIGNGDIDTPAKAKFFLEKDYCDAIMIGRAAIGNPHIFRQIHDLLQKDKNTSPNEGSQKLKHFLEYYELAKKHGILNTPALKNQAQYFTKGLKDSTHIRELLSKAKDEKDILKIIKRYKSRILKKII